MSIKKKIYEDYFKKSRLPSYEDMLSLAKKNGYRMMGILDFKQFVEERNGNLEGVKILLNRHDIDTSSKVAGKMFDIENKVYGTAGSSTFYFRNSTLSVPLIKKIESFGYETGYHYEELATFEKKYKIKNAEKLRLHLPDIRYEFEKDLKEYREITGTESLSVASHGEFVNTMLDMQSVTILEDSDLRKNLNIIVEAYDYSITQYITSRFADHVLLDKFVPSVSKAILQGDSVIMILTHPRNWQVDVLENTRANIVRFIEGVSYGKIK